MAVPHSNCAVELTVFRRTLTPTPASRPCPRLRRGRSKAHAPLARKQRLFAPRGEGLLHPSPLGRSWRVSAG
ncbi:hypothetical protein EIQ06_18370 [Xanthomonas campestris pv. campestris]|nr:hypothetical protein DFG55_12290 [Xanthomonas campestris pv. campestris]QCX72411.1 hypothetical protein DFG54_18130 [Xanthomonas campestris pv. campestris]RFF49814.1 hypothetical protein D0A42_04005 [Xanthomonas campestris pv. campestris]RFF77062.1 hypothetical protein DZE36_01645 [Xanthomonas campestris pv. campestris]